ncbi:MAG TPA: GDSL-type esterase/lipase family protein [Chthoniobacteraceae bacterium]|jgi:lysophospholipase L1-like esterase|nr:GDSL-type esterase/lipase family protein [Chthoniobacteraceae bacterium]
MKNLSTLCLTLLCAATFSLGTGVRADEIPASATWPLPVVSPGANPDIIPTPRNEWVERVQQTLNRTQGKHFDLVFDGDSITDHWQGVGKGVWEQRYGALNAVDFGISADKVENLLWRLQEGQVEGIDPKLVVLMIGTNNLGRDNVNQISEGISKVTAEYLKRCPHAHLLLLAIFPRSPLATDPVRAKIAAINKNISALQSDRVTYLDIGAKFLQPDGKLTPEIMPDYLHPSAKGYVIWADAIQDVVNKYVPKQGAQ